ncbi:MAG: MFS transporter [Planctomycetaceae bacterium]|nr:MFS transporter [Planctomycetaceae bacterium]
MSPDDVVTRHERRNLSVLAVQNVVLRIGWIFKTESVIMPAFMDAISGAGWLRGLLPILSRLGQSVPPLLFSDWMRTRPLKKTILVLTALQMAWPFLLLSLLWWQLEDRRQWWMPVLFLVLYFYFFSATGLNQLAFGTLQGKLIRPNRRGLLLGIGGIVGSLGAVTAALGFLRPWLMLPNQDGFTQVFLFNGGAFLIAGCVALFCTETRDDDGTARPFHLTKPFQEAWKTYRTDRAFRRAARVAMLFITSFLLFPHYQWLGREQLGTSSADLIIWVVAQNISVGILSPILGWVADQFGNRLAIRIAVFASAATPLIAMSFVNGLSPLTPGWYWLTFVFLGLVPVTMKAILNYTLELVETPDHPRYQSTMSLCFAIPFLFSPFVGLAIDRLPFEIPFVVVSGLIMVGGILTFWMSEPRDSLELAEKTESVV